MQQTSSGEQEQAAVTRCPAGGAPPPLENDPPTDSHTGGAENQENKLNQKNVTECSSFKEVE